MFDSHVHLDFIEDSLEPLAELRRARDVGVSNWLVPGVSLDESAPLESLRNEPGVHTAVGIHPWFAKPGDALLESELGQRAQVQGAVAIGECGVDAKRSGLLPLSEQLRLFEMQLSLAGELELPVVLHQVGARDEFLTSLKRVGVPARGGVVHGFLGDENWGLTLVRRGLCLGLGGNLFGPTASRLRQAAARLPASSLLVETDAPARVRGRPEALLAVDLPEVVSELARIRGETSEALALTTMDNARQLFLAAGGSSLPPP